MSKCFILSETRTSDEAHRTALLKPREDIERVLESLGMQRVPFPNEHDGRHTSSALAKIEEHARSFALWQKALSGFGKGDTVFLQYPPLNPCIWLHRIIESKTRQGTRFILIVHDSVSLRAMTGADVPSWQKGVYMREESRALNASWRTSVHTMPMREKVASMLHVDAGKLLTLGIFDYLIDEADLPASAGKDAALVVAGNLSPEKAGYLYELPPALPVNLYGIGIDESRLREGLAYCGSYPSEELPRHLSGSFGIVWDGGSARTCEGSYGDYLRYNSPHKLSLYLACNMPVIIWEKAAQAAFVNHHNLGLTVNSLEDLPERIASLTEGEYRAMRDAAAVMGRKLRSGWYTCNLVASLG